MTPFGRRACSFTATALLLLVLVACSRPPPEPVSTGNRVEEPTLDHGASAVVQRAFEQDLREAEATLQIDELLRRDVSLDGSITRVERLPADGGITVRATVSLSVRDAEGGQILVVLDGTGQATGPTPGRPAERDAFDYDVISGAVSGLLTQLEQRLRELQAQSEAGAEAGV